MSGSGLGHLRGAATCFCSNLDAFFMMRRDPSFDSFKSLNNVSQLEELKMILILSLIFSEVSSCHSQYES